MSNSTSSHRMWQVLLVPLLASMLSLKNMSSHPKHQCKRSSLIQESPSITRVCSPASLWTEHRFNQTDLQHTSIDGPDWVKFDSDSLLISGTAPSENLHQQVEVTAVDKYGDQAVLTLILTSSASLIVGVIGTLKATAGLKFMYTFDRNLFNGIGLDIAIDLGVTRSWLSFDQVSLTLRGTPPNDTINQEDQLNVTASKDGQTTVQSFILEVISDRSSGDQPSTSSRSSSTPTATMTSNSSPQFGGIGPNRRIIAAAIAVPIVLVILAVITCCCYCKRAKLKTSSPVRKLLEARAMSRPIFQSSSLMQPDDMEKATPVLHKQSLSRAPRLEIQSRKHDSIFRWSMGRSLRRSGVEMVGSMTSTQATGEPRPESLTVPLVAHQRMESAKP